MPRLCPRCGRFEMLTGRRPFEAGAPVQVLLAQRNGPSVFHLGLRVCAHIGHVVDRLLATRPVF